MLAKAKAWFLHSVTILIARVVAFGSLILGALVNVGDFFNSPSVSAAVQAVLKPALIPWYGLAIAALVEIARRRTLPKA
jgi:hypothetical protein